MIRSELLSICFCPRDIARGMPFKAFSIRLRQLATGFQFVGGGVDVEDDALGPKNDNWFVPDVLVPDHRVGPIASISAIFGDYERL